jgi:RNA polymerase sigma factor (sigma-70 family)
MGSDHVEKGRRWSQWMAQAQDGAHAAYGQLLKDCTPFIRAMVRRRMFQPEQAEDVVQDVLLTIHRVRHTYDPTRPFLPWLIAIIDRRCIDVLRRRGRIQASETHDEQGYDQYADPMAGAGVDQSGDADEVRALLAELPARQREALELLKLRELSLAEAADATGQTVGALKISVHRAMRALKQKFGGGR